MKKIIYILFLSLTPHLLAGQPVEYLITDFGAKNDNLDDTDAVQKAIDNVTMDGVETPLFIKLGNRNSAWKEKTEFETGSIKNIRINNVTAVNTGRITSSITGYEGQYVDNVTLSNIRFESIAYEGKTDPELEIDERSNYYPYNRMFGFDYPVYGFYVNYVDNITFDNVEFAKHKSDTRPALKFENSRGSRLINVRTSEKEYEKEDIETDNLILH